MSTSEIQKFLVFVVLFISVTTNCATNGSNTPSGLGAQTATPQPSRSEVNETVNAISITEGNLEKCSFEYWDKNSKKKSEDDVKRNAEVMKKCRKDRIAELSEIYTKVAKQPELFERLLSTEMDLYDFRSAITMNSVAKSSMEVELERQTNELKRQSALQKIAVLQNQRIIDLLEGLGQSR